MMPISSAKQRGAVLIISMIILLLLTILGVTSMQSTTLEERMAGNMRDRHLAFEAAEAALLHAEQFLDSIATTGAFDTDGSDGLYDDSIQKIWTTVDWTGAASGANGYRQADNIGTGEGLSTPPKYVIQHVVSVGSEADQSNLDNYGQGTGAGKTGLFRVTARGTGSSDNSVVILQTVFGVGGL
jgi:type IV pilus assembly protein PilX